MLLVQFNSFQRSTFYTFANSFTGNIQQNLNEIKEYLTLKEVNNHLLIENTRLKNKLKNLEYISMDSSVSFIKDSVRFHYMHAKVLNNSVNKQYNYITIDKGSAHGIKPEMAVVSSEGVVGITHIVSKNFSSVLSVINRKLKLSAKISKNGYYGSLFWGGGNYQYANLYEIPYHVKLSKNDTIVTSGYSSIFPENILIGTIEKWSIEEGNFYNIEVKLSTDFKKLSWVYVIENQLKEEQTALENTIEND